MRNKFYVLKRSNDFLEGIAGFDRLRDAISFVKRDLKKNYLEDAVDYETRPYGLLGVTRYFDLSYVIAEATSPHELKLNLHPHGLRPNLATLEKDDVGIHCPLCESKHFNYTETGDTHVWVCGNCPAVLFEYYDQVNVEVVAEYLNKPEKYYGVIYPDSHASPYCVGAFKSVKDFEEFIKEWLSKQPLAPKLYTHEGGISVEISLPEFSYIPARSAEDAKKMNENSILLIDFSEQIKKEREGKMNGSD